MPSQLYPNFHLGRFPIKPRQGLVLAEYHRMSNLLYFFWALTGENGEEGEPLNVIKTSKP